MHKVESNRITDLGGNPGFLYTVFFNNWTDSYLECGEETIVSRIDTIVSYTLLDGIRSKFVLEAMRGYYDKIWAFNSQLNRYEVDATQSLLSVWVLLGDLVYWANPWVTSGQTRMLIAALNTGLIDRIIFREADNRNLIERYLAQSHANPRALARGLYDGWLICHRRDPAFILSQPVEIVVPLSR